MEIGTSITRNLENRKLKWYGYENIMSQKRLPKIYFTDHERVSEEEENLQKMENIRNTMDETDREDRKLKQKMINPYRESRKVEEFKPATRSKRQIS